MEPQAAAAFQQDDIIRCVLSKYKFASTANERKETDSGYVGKAELSGLRDQLGVWGKGIEGIKSGSKRYIWGTAWLVEALAKRGTQVYRQNS